MKRFSVMGCAVLLLLTVGLIPGCRGKTAMSEQVAVTAIGLHEKDGLVLSAQTVDSLKTAASLSEQDKAATTVYTAADGSVSTALEALLSQTGRQAYILHTQLLVLSEARCAAAPLSDSLDHAVRGGEVRLQVPLTVCRGDPAALLALDSGNDAIPAQYTVGLLREGARRGVSVYRTVLDVERALADGGDVTLPIVTVRDKTVVPDGTALFRDGRLAGELNTRQTAGLLLLAGELSERLIELDGVTYRVDGLRCRITVGQTIAFSVSGAVRVVERKTGAAPQIEAVQRLLCDDMRDTLRVLDAVGCDALSLAARLRQHTPSLTVDAARVRAQACEKTVRVVLQPDTAA